MNTTKSNRHAVSEEWTTATVELGNPQFRAGQWIMEDPDELFAFDGSSSHFLGKPFEMSRDVLVGRRCVAFRRACKRMVEIHSFIEWPNHYLCNSSHKEAAELVRRSDCPLDAAKPVICCDSELVAMRIKPEHDYWSAAVYAMPEPVVPALDLVDQTDRDCLRSLLRQAQELHDAILSDPLGHISLLQREGMFALGEHIQVPADFDFDGLLPAPTPEQELRAMGDL